MMHITGTALRSIHSIRRFGTKLLFPVCLALALSVTVARTVESQVRMGPPPDTVWVDNILYEYPPPPMAPRLLMTGSVDTLNMSGLDCSGFPIICTFVEVLDLEGFPVGGLTPDSFCVYQDGQPIDSFSVVELNIDSCYTSVCLVVDISGSMADNDKIDSAKASMHTFVSNMDAFDRVAIVTFANCVDTLIDFTSDTTALHAAITSLTAGGNTACFDGVWLGVNLTIGEIGSKAVIAFTDGLENRSHLCWPPPDGVTDNSYTDDSAIVCNLANSAGIPIYTFNLGPIGNTFFNPEAMQAFATGTGGSWYHAPNSLQIDSVYGQIKQRLCSRYYVCYLSPDTVSNGDVHTTKVCYYNSATDSCGPCDSSTCQETDVPKIVRTPPTVDLEDTCQSPTSPMTICAYVTDADTDPEDLTVKLFYRTQAGSYTDVVMMLQPDDSTFCHTIPAGQLTCKDFVEYFLTASDGASTVSSPGQNPLTNPYHIELCFHAPVAVCPGNDTLARCDLSTICIPGFSASDGDGDLVSVVAVGGTLSGDTICFTPVGGANTLQLIATDACGRVDSCSTEITVTITDSTGAACHIDTSVTVCNLSPICLPDFACSDADSSHVVGGTLSGDTVCFVPIAGPNTLKLICYGPCGVDTCISTVTVTLIPPAVANCPENSVQNVCNVSEVQPIPGFTYSNGTATVTGGTLNGNTVTITNPMAGPNFIQLITTGACGADTCQTTVTVNLSPHDPPTCPGNSSQTVCNLSEVQPVPGFSCNGTPTVIGGTLSAGSVTLTNPVEGPNVIKLICASACGTDTCQTTVTVDVDEQPVCPDLPDTTSVRICELYEYCLDLDASATGLTCQVVSGPGTVQGDQWCYTPQSLSDTVTVTLACEDGCSNSCQTTFTVAFHTDNNCGDCPQICIDTLTALPNSLASVCITVTEGGIPWGGFDFLIGYDPSLLTFMGADPGQFLIDCDWEYFTYRILGRGKVRLVAIADMNNSNDHPVCLTPGPGDVIACLNFKVTGDWNLACHDALVQWTWVDCADNAISDPSGDTLYIASSAPGSVVNFDGVDLTGQPALGGPPFPCPSDKGIPQECTHFCGGKIRIICPGEIDDRGDLNLNSVAYEIADAVLFSNYFILGPSVFTLNYDGQAAASDVNADGVPLTVADLVYLIRVITGDALPIAEDLLGAARAGATAGSLLVSSSREGDLLKVEGECDLELGGALFVFNLKSADVRNVVPGPRASTMDVRYATGNGSLRVLLYNIEDRGRVAPGDGELFHVELFGEETPELLSVEAATFDGAALDASLETRVVPETFALHPNTPNPFNPTTELAASFPHASDYTLTIYNIMGQVVTTFRGEAPAGRLSLTWDGQDSQGQSVASGVYFYALRAGDFSAMRKMVLMK